MRRYADFWRRAFAGLLIGIGAVLPGISGGIIAVSFGLYQPMLEAVLGLFRHFKRSVRFLLPLGIGGVAGVMIGAKGLGLFMTRYEAPLLFLFTGFIVGGIPDLLKEADRGEPFRLRRLWALALGIALALPLAMLSQNGMALRSLAPLQALLAGFIEGAGTVIPGVSSSFVLIHLGWYSAYLKAIATLDVATLVPLALGFLVSALITMKTVQWLFQRFRAHAYYGVLGFLLVSVALVFPGFETESPPALNLALLALGLAGSLWMGRISGGTDSETLQTAEQFPHETIWKE